jgi:hypothetical protein
MTKDTNTDPYNGELPTDADLGVSDDNDSEDGAQDGADQDGAVHEGANGLIPDTKGLAADGGLP